MNVRDLLINTTKKFHDAGIDSASLDAQVLLSFVLDKDRSWLIAHGDYELSVGAMDEFGGYVARREKREPLAYILGYKEFYGLRFEVSPFVLIPRPETEELVDMVLEWSGERSGIRMLDVGTGSGCIPLAVASKKKDIHIVGVEYSEQALKLARLNARHFGFENVSFVHGDLLNSVDGVFDIITANLPYLSEEEYIEALKDFPELGFEPKSALVSGNNGLFDIYSFLDSLGVVLAPGAIAILEIGMSQGGAVKGYAKNVLSECDVRVVQDSTGRDRFVVIEKT